MARGGRSNKRMRSFQRDAISITQRPIALADTLEFIEDNRRFNPEPLRDRPILDALGRPSRFFVSPSVRVHRRSVVARSYFSNTPVGLQVPVGVKVRSLFPVVVCVRRKIRKAVMFALGKTGKGAKARRRRRNSRSDVRC